MRQAFFLVAAIVLAACQANGVANPALSIASPQQDASTRVHLTIVNGFTTAAEFSQLSNCGLPFPLSDQWGKTDWQVQGLASDALTQTGPACFDKSKGQHTYILAGWIWEKYDCGIDIARTANGAYSFTFYLQGAQTACSITQRSATEATFTWNLK